MNEFVKKKTSQVIIGIEASNLNSGGGLTHLLEILNNFSIHKHTNIKTIYIWSNKKTLSKISNYKYIKKVNNFFLQGNLLLRFFWQIFFSENEFIKKKCDIVLIPGGSYIGKFKNIVSISQNLLPFTQDYKKYTIKSWYYYKFLALKYIQLHTFKKSKSVIFLTDYAKEVILKHIDIKNYEIIPHGINQRFYNKKNKNLSNLENNPFVLTYVSNIDVYKNHSYLIEAFKKISKENNVILNLIGNIHPVFKKKYSKKKIKTLQNYNINIIQDIYYEDIHEIYFNSDGFIFASSCENMPNILLEAMASKLPIICSNMRPMTDILSNKYYLFNPFDEKDIAMKIKFLINNKKYREESSNESYSLAMKYNWAVTSEKIFNCLYKNI